MAHYSEYKPNVHFQKYVDRFWFMEIDREEDLMESLVVPDNFFDLLFCHTPIVRENKITNESRAIHTQLAGLKSCPQKVIIQPGCKISGIRFKPNGLAKFANLNLSELIDLSIDPVEIFGKDFLFLEESILYENNKEIIILRLENFLFEQMIKTDRNDDPFMEFALQKVIRSNGNIKLDSISQESGFCLKTIERKFAEWIGIPPKKFARIYRFHSTLRSFIESNPDKLSELAYRNGYFDQAHFIREVKIFTGLTPSEYFNTHNTSPDHNLQHAIHTNMEV